MIIDLSVPINEQTPVYPGDPIVKLQTSGVLEKDGYSDHTLSIGTHVGTHIDAPLHMLPGTKQLDQIPIDRFVGRGRLISLEDGKYDVELVKQSDIQEGDIVLFHTSMSDHYHNPSYFEDYPGIPKEIAEYLVEKKVKMVGVDTCSVDHEPFTIHKLLLGAEVLIIENLTNLQELKNKDFTVYALPIKLQIDGAPARVIAVI